MEGVRCSRQMHRQRRVLALGKTRSWARATPQPHTAPRGRGVCWSPQQPEKKAGEPVPKAWGVRGLSGISLLKGSSEGEARGTPSVK